MTGLGEADRREKAMEDIRDFLTNLNGEYTEQIRTYFLPNYLSCTADDSRVVTIALDESDIKALAELPQNDIDLIKVHR
jgi:hypothetical protein